MCKSSRSHFRSDPVRVQSTIGRGTWRQGRPGGTTNVGWIAVSQTEPSPTTDVGPGGGGSGPWPSRALSLSLYLMLLHLGYLEGVEK